MLIPTDGTGMTAALVLWTVARGDHARGLVFMGGRRSRILRCVGTLPTTGQTGTTRHEPGGNEPTTEIRVSRRGACHTETERRHVTAVRVSEHPDPPLYTHLQLPPDFCRHHRDAPRAGRQDQSGCHRQCPEPPPAGGEHAAT